ncbi:hypothetical protein RND81_03G157600 [Saponaria officinalis]|uniref:Helitron helicase-like domain-containing protein n=1 Tax=Saponaria officinalis TaxID=3572 RepID=A0AAW1M812_SAPOF
MEAGPLAGQSLLLAAQRGNARQNRYRRSWIIAHRRGRGTLYGRYVDPSLFTQTTYHSYLGVSKKLCKSHPYISKINRYIRRYILTSRRRMPKRYKTVQASSHVRETKRPKRSNKGKAGDSSRRTTPARAQTTSGDIGSTNETIEEPSQLECTRACACENCTDGGDCGSSSRLHSMRSSVQEYDTVKETNSVINQEDTDLDGLDTCTLPGRVYTKAWSFGGPNQTCEYCDAVVWSNESVGQLSKSGRPQFSICCQKGKVRLLLLKDPPDYLTGLLDPNGGRRSSEFRRLIRSYNMIYAFTSMGGKVDNAINQGSAPYCFRLGGQNHHNIGSFFPPDGKQPRFLQLYFYDTELEVSQRISSLKSEGKNELDPEIVEGLSKMLYEHNALAKVCKMARERLDPSCLQPVQLRLIGNRKKDGRQYNLPSTDELAALIVGGGETSTGNRDIIIYDRCRGVRKISELHPSFMAMQYPLMFPYGEDGYRPDIKHNDAETTTRKKRTFVTMREYYAFRFQERRKDEKLIDGINVLCGRLRQQFMVDAFTCVEETRLNYVRSNQAAIRKYSLRGLIDAVIAGNTRASLLGHSMILPASFPGCFRFLFQNYQDALAICRWAGPPDLFITFTCNPKWVEIEEFLKSHPGQRPEERPDVIARVFKIKLNELIRDITKGAFFGRVLAGIIVIHFSFFKVCSITQSNDVY